MKIIKNLIVIVVSVFLILGLTSLEAASEKSNSSFTEFKYKNFTKINASGIWEVNIKRGEKYKIIVYSSAEMKDYIAVDKVNDILYLKTKTRPWAWFKKTTDADRLRVEITMPYFEKLEASGECKVNFSDFNLGIFNIDISGKVKVTCANNKITNLFIESSGESSVVCKSKINNLSIEASGTSDLDFKSSTVLNANVYLNGTSKVILKMRGGNLNGNLSGDSSLTYEGKIKTQNVLISGSGTVIKK